MEDGKTLRRFSILHPRFQALPRLRFCIKFPHENPIGHPAQRRAASRKLFRDDAPGHRASGKRRGVLFHRGLSFDDLAVRRRRTPQEHARRGAGLPRLRPRPAEIRVLQTIRRAASHRAFVAALDRHADEPVGKRALVQRQVGERNPREPRVVCVSRADGGGHFNLRFQHRARGPRPEAARGDDARHRHQVQRAIRPDLRDSRAADPR